MIKRLLSTGVVALTSVALLTSSVSADVLNQRDNNNSILQTIPDANPATDVVRTITVTQNEIIQDIAVTIEGLNHTFLGDLVATISKVDSSGNVITGANGNLLSATLFSRVQVSQGPLGFPGSSSNFNGDYTFVDQTGVGRNPRDLWAEVELEDSSFEVLPSQPNQSTINQFSSIVPGAFFATDSVDNPVSLANIFAGESTEGTYEFRIRDERDTAEGSFTGVTLNFQSIAVPEPAMGLMAVALGGLFLTRRRRKIEA